MPYRGHAVSLTRGCDYVALTPWLASRLAPRMIVLFFYKVVIIQTKDEFNCIAIKDFYFFYKVSYSNKI